MLAGAAETLFSHSVVVVQICVCGGSGGTVCEESVRRECVLFVWLLRCVEQDGWRESED